MASCFTGCSKNGNQSITEQPESKIYPDSVFMMGADLSYVNALLDAGIQFKNKTGEIKNPYDIFKETGTNVVRVRLWHTPSWQIPLYGKIKYHDKNDVINTIKQSKDAGMKVLLDLHYSDNWADPNKQETPEQWKNLSLQKLSDSIYQYTFTLLMQLSEMQLVPEYIQIGNENNTGICHPVGKINNNNFYAFSTLLASGCKAVRDFSTTSVIKPKIIIHVAQFKDAKWWADGILTSGIMIDYDILGVSHYYKWSGDNNWTSIKQKIRELKIITKKDVLVLETAFPWTNLSKDAYANILTEEGIPPAYSATKEGQNKYLTDFTQTIIDGGGIGIFYWEPAWVSSSLRDQWGTGSSWENNAFFDFENTFHPTLTYMTHPYTF
jgi:arabinogalactan endo-1,4-beta-galactosidase